MFVHTAIHKNENSFPLKNFINSFSVTPKMTKNHNSVI